MKHSAKKILIVEDDTNFGNILKEYLSLNDYEIALAKNGIEGFEKFKKEAFDLCILDVMMPYKDGFTLAKEIREINDLVPIFFLSAKHLKEDVLKGFKVGADDYLTKPFDSEVLLAKIKAILSRSNTPASLPEDIFEFQFSDFSFNSKLRFLTYKEEENNWTDAKISLSLKYFFFYIFILLH